MNLPAFVLFNGLLLSAAICDVKAFRIPNVLSGSLALAGLVAHPPASWTEFLARLASVVIVVVVCGLMWTRRMIGGGDLKLLMACAVWIPVATLGGFAIWLGWLGAFQGLATLALLRWTPLASHAAASERARSQIPYGVSIAGAGLLWSLPALSL